MTKKEEEMGRPKKYRIVEYSLKPTNFKPDRQYTDHVELTIDELEAIRLADLEKLYQEEAAEIMGVSRQTFGRIVKSAHKKIADALVNIKEIRTGKDEKCRNVKLMKCESCGKIWRVPDNYEGNECPECHAKNVHILKIND
jgi:predicted DNA-binding protein (UPF0251 family)